ncbi:hypothetical protein QTP86_015375 [Hemibagrus guttatus]|nr:hypothetical protein QTP86_015375 [Hemibagrus guttatus]
MGSGAVLEPPALTEAGTEVQGNRMETPGTTPMQGDGGDVDMVDEPVFKVPNKRKKQGEQNKRAKLYGILKQKHIDVMLQETHSDISNAADWVKEWDGFYVCTLPPVQWRGWFFLDTLSNVIADCDTADILILGGDFNCTTDDLDRNHAEPHVASRKRLWEVMEAHKLSDIWRTFNKNKRQYTWAHAYTLNVTRDIVRSLKALQIKIVELQRLEATRNRGHFEALKSKKAKMNDLLDIIAQGALVRSRFKSAAEMDAPSKFFFSSEQKNGQKRFIHAVRTESGELLSEPTEIHKQTVSFYSKLYSSEWSGHK